MLVEAPAVSHWEQGKIDTGVFILPAVLAALLFSAISSAFREWIFKAITKCILRKNDYYTAQMTLILRDRYVSSALVEHWKETLTNAHKTFIRRAGYCKSLAIVTAIIGSLIICATISLGYIREVGYWTYLAPWPLYLTILFLLTIWIFERRQTNKVAILCDDISQFMDRKWTSSIPACHEQLKKLRDLVAKGPSSTEDSETEK